MDLSKLTDAELDALERGDLTKLSDAALDALEGKPAGKAKAKPTMLDRFKREAIASLPGGIARGVKDVIDTGAEYASKLGPKGEAERVRAMNEAGKAEYATAADGDIMPAVGRFGGQMMGAGPAVGAAGRVVGLAAPRLGAAISTYGAAGGNKLADIGIRSAGGAVAGGLAAGQIDPESAGWGAGIGGALPLAGRVLKPAIDLGAGVAKGVGKAAYRVAEPYLPGGIAQIEGRTLNALAGDRAPQVIAALRGSRGAQHAGEAATEAGAAPFAAGQEIIKNRFATSDYLAIEQAQEAARLAAVRSIGKDKPALDSAIALRRSAAASNYGDAAPQLVKADPTLLELLSRPSMEKALRRAEELADEASKGAFKVGENAPARVVPGLIVNEAGQSITQTIIPATAEKYPVQSLHYIKMAMDDMVKNPERFAIGATEQKAIEATKGTFVDWLGKKSPKYDFARTEHARLSVPINRMEVGQYLENKLASPIASERPAMFAQALRDAPGTLKRATGNSRYDELGQVLSAREVGAARNVLAELNRGEQYSRQATAGRQEAQKILGLEFKTHEPPGILHRGVMVARTLLERLQGKATEKTLQQLAIDMQNPKRAAELMELAGQDGPALAAWAKVQTQAKRVGSAVGGARGSAITGSALAIGEN
jgi:hypothetical protein